MKKFLFSVIFVCFFVFSALAGDKEVMQQAYQLILDNHINDIDLSSVFAPAFSSLNKIDKNIRLVLEKSGVSVYKNNKLIKVYSRPKNEKDAKEWAEFSYYILEELKKISPKIQHKDFELVEFILYNGIKKFDKNSNYFPVLDLGQTVEEIQGYNSGIINDGILYIRLGTINDYTAESLNDTLENSKDVKGILLDLRGNKGGYLKQAVNIADEFLSEGKIIYTLGKNKSVKKVYQAKKGEKFKSIPIVVLVDGKTASAAEVISVALKDNRRANVIGGQTYGKGTVQNIYALDNGAHLALTTEVIYGPRGLPVDEIGVRPSVCSEVFATTSNIDELINYPYNFLCKKLSRNSTFDLNVGLRVLENMIKGKTD